MQAAFDLTVRLFCDKITPDFEKDDFIEKVFQFNIGVGYAQRSFFRLGRRCHLS